MSGETMWLSFAAASERAHLAAPRKGFVTGFPGLSEGRAFKGNQSSGSCRIVFLVWERKAVFGFPA